MNVKIVHWAVAMITPIFISDSKMNPTNYRGISIQSCLGKLFTAILNQRLLKYALEKQILKDEQVWTLICPTNIHDSNVNKRLQHQWINEVTLASSPFISPRLSSSTSIVLRHVFHHSHQH